MSAEHNPLGWFEIPVTDMDRAVGFYERVLGLPLDMHEMGEERMAWFPSRPGEPGCAGALVMAQGYEPSLSGVVIYFTCPDIGETLEKVAEAGGKVLLERTGIGRYGFVGFLEDSEGNRSGLHSRE
ncbi:VOC family protein [Candidatus Fermentibacterales bacterium]|nr:VOC family protein [Candidatus Fermentibacterales bacterium]